VMLKGRIGIRVLEGVQAPVLEIAQPRCNALSSQREQAEDMIAVRWKATPRTCAPILDSQPDSFTTEEEPTVAPERLATDP
jgi:hypothetical protein